MLAGCGSKTPPPEPWAFSRQVGVVSGACFAIRNPSLAAGTPLHLVNAMPPQSDTAARVEGTGGTCASGELSAFRVAPQAGPVPAIGIVGFGGSLQSDGGMLSADLDGDGQREYFRACTSSEGVHLTIWTGKPLTGRLRWHGYQALGYDVEPDCKPEETVDVK